MKRLNITLVFIALLLMMLIGSTYIYQQGIQEGHTTGMEQGYDRGYTKGKTDGYTEGKTDGYTEGKTAGYTDGFTQEYQNIVSGCFNYPFLFLDQSRYVACRRQ